MISYYFPTSAEATNGVHEVVATVAFIVWIFLESETSIVPRQNWPIFGFATNHIRALVSRFADRSDHSLVRPRNWVELILIHSNCCLVSRNEIVTANGTVTTEGEHQRIKSLLLFSKICVLDAVQDPSEGKAVSRGYGWLTSNMIENIITSLLNSRLCTCTQYTLTMIIEIDYKMI